MRKVRRVNDGSIERMNPAIPAIHLENVHLTLASEAGRVNILKDIHDWITDNQRAVVAALA